MADGVSTERQRVQLAGEASVEASMFLPSEPRATVVCLPALGVVASYYEPLATALAARGLAAVTADLRGLGTSSVRPGRGVDFGYRELVDDAWFLIQSLRPRLPTPLVVLGHSLGGHVGALLAGTHPDAIDALALCACGTPYWRRFSGRTAAGVYVLGVLAAAMGPVLGHFPGNRIGFSGREAARLMREWSTLARSGRLVAAGLDAERAFGSAAVPVLAVSVAGDWMAPRSAVDHLVEKLSSARVERAHVDARGADPRALDHFKWVKYPDAVVDLLTRWLSAGVTSSVTRCR